MSAMSIFSLFPFEIIHNIVDSIFPPFNPNKSPASCDYQISPWDTDFIESEVGQLIIKENEEDYYYDNSEWALCTYESMLVASRDFRPLCYLARRTKMIRWLLESGHAIYSHALFFHIDYCAFYLSHPIIPINLKRVMNSLEWISQNSYYRDSLPELISPLVRRYRRIGEDWLNPGQVFSQERNLHLLTAITTSTEPDGWGFLLVDFFCKAEFSPKDTIKLLLEILLQTIDSGNFSLFQARLSYVENQGYRLPISFYTKLVLRSLWTRIIAIQDSFSEGTTIRQDDRIIYSALQSLFSYVDRNVKERRITFLAARGRLRRIFRQVFIFLVLREDETRGDISPIISLHLTYRRYAVFNQGLVRKTIKKIIRRCSLSHSMRFSSGVEDVIHNAKLHLNFSHKELDGFLAKIDATKNKVWEDPELEYLIHRQSTNSPPLMEPFEPHTPASWGEDDSSTQSSWME